MSEPQPATPPEVIFNIERIYIKDSSFESPNAPQVFLEKTAPDVSVQLAIEHKVIDPDPTLFECALSITVTATQAGKTVFLAEAKQAGLFRIQGLPEAERVKFLEIGCPTILLPFVREALNGLIERGGFPQLLINPINFEVLYQQKHENATAH